MFIVTTNWPAVYAVFTTVAGNNTTSTRDNSTPAFGHNIQCRSASCSPGQCVLKWVEVESSRNSETKKLALASDYYNNNI
ncbi:MAG: hypothetical protein ACJ719_10525 [Nitrososphaeraceae archaeon]